MSETVWTSEIFGNFVVGIVTIHETAVDYIGFLPRPPNFCVYFVCFPNTGFYTDPVPVTVTIAIHISWLQHLTGTMATNKTN